MNITFAVDKEIVGKAREVAKARGTTLNALIRQYLQSPADEDRRIVEANAGFRKLMQESKLEFLAGADLKKLARSDD